MVFVTVDRTYDIILSDHNFMQVCIRGNSPYVEAMLQMTVSKALVEHEEFFLINTSSAL